MILTMVKEELLIIILLCAITLTISAKSIEFVREFDIDNQTGNKNEKGRLVSSKHTHTEAAAITIKNTKNSKTTEKASNNEADDSMYTESDLEEAVSREQKHVGPKTTKNDPDVKDESNLRKDSSALLDVYTESDLEETASRDNDKVKHEIEKRSANSYLYIPPNKDGLEGSGTGSGDGPVMI